MAARPRNPKACLLGLPAELRNRILLDVATSAAFNSDGDRNDINLPYADSSHKVLFRSFYINKQLFHELSALFNGNNRFGLCAKPTSVARQVMLLCDKSPSDADVFTDRLLARHTLTEIRSYFTKDTYIAYDMKDFGKFKGLHLPHTATRSSIRHVRMFIPLSISLLVSDVFYEDIFGGGELDWLHPLRAFRALGFVEVQNLEVVIYWKASHLPLQLEFPKWFTITQSAVQEWVQNEVDRMDLDGIEVLVTFAGLRD